MEEAKGLGLTPHHATGELKLQEMINEELGKGESEVIVKVDEVVKGDDKVTTEIKPKIETKLQRTKRLRDEQRKLIRVVVRCNNSKKKEWQGETVSVICAAGTLKKWVPFDNEEGWHVPQAILDVMGAKYCQKFKKTKLKNGQEHNTSFTVKEFTIEILKPLTKAQLKKLAADQSARGSID